MLRKNASLFRKIEVITVTVGERWWLRDSDLKSGRSGHQLILSTMCCRQVRDCCECALDIIWYTRHSNIEFRLHSYLSFFQMIAFNEVQQEGISVLCTASYDRETYPLSRTECKSESVQKTLEKTWSPIRVTVANRNHAWLILWRRGRQPLVRQSHVTLLKNTVALWWI